MDALEPGVERINFLVLLLDALGSEPIPDGSDWE